MDMARGIALNRRIFIIGFLMITVSLLILGFPFSPHVASIVETYSDCQKTTINLRAAILIAQGICEPTMVMYYVLLSGVFVGIIIIIVGFLVFAIKILKKLDRLDKKDT